MPSPQRAAACSVVLGNPAHAVVAVAGGLLVLDIDGTKVDIPRTIEGRGNARGGIPGCDHHGMTVIAVGAVAIGVPAVEVVAGARIVSIAEHPVVGQVLRR